MFSVWNQTTFQYYPHFIALYSALIVAAIALHYYRKKKLDKNKRLEKKILRNMSNSFAWIAIFGYFFLGARYAYVYFLSMEFMHILLLILLVWTLVYYGLRWKYGYKKKKRKSN